MRRLMPLATFLLLVLLLPAPQASAADATGSISGTVKITDTTDPFVMTVRVFDLSQTLVAEAFTFPSGDYSVSGLAAGSYKLQFAGQWYSSQTSFGDADPVVVNAGLDTAGIKVNFLSGQFGWIEGRVYDALTNDPACATILGTVRPGADGTYRLGLPPGPWKIDFIDNCDFKYAEQWWNGKADESTADVLNVVAGETYPNIDAAMAMPQDDGGWISGVVTDADTGGPIAGICVNAYLASGEPRTLPPNAVGAAPTRSDGAYRVGFLGDGEIRLEFVDCQNSAYESKWWASGPDFAGADPIKVTLGEEVSGIDISLDLKPGAVRPTTTVPGELPFTGVDGSMLALAAISLLVLGASTVVAARSDRRTG